jgi:hypothetical protein
MLPNKPVPDERTLLEVSWKAEKKLKIQLFTRTVHLAEVPLEVAAPTQAVDKNFPSSP